jgi:hypothetical protein
MYPSGQDSLYPLREIAPFQEDPVPASLALNADIRSQADHFPLFAPAGMRLPQLHYIAQGKIGQHTIIITTPRAI